MIKSIIFLFFSLLTTNPSINTLENDIQKKVIRDGEFDIVCYVSLKERSNYSTNKMYYWYKSGEVHNSQSAAGGHVLHKSFTRYYRDNQLIEQGNFHYGLKDGVWKTWYENGQLKEKVEWCRGFKSGSAIAYDSIGNVVKKGKYRKNAKAGKWVDIKTKDTLVFKKGAIYTDADKANKQNIFKRVFRNKYARENGAGTTIKRSPSNRKNQNPKSTKKVQKSSKKASKSSKKDDSRRFYAKKRQNQLKKKKSKKKDN